MTDKKIRLFVDAHAFDKEFQGAQTFLRELYTDLLGLYPELDIYFGAYDTAYIQQVFPALSASHILPYQHRNSGMLRFIFEIPSYIRRYKFDFAHFQYLAPLLKSKCRYIVTLHDILFNDFKDDFSPAFRTSRNILFGRSIRLADIKTTVSSYSQHRICAYYQIAEDQVHVIPNGVNEDLKKRYQSKSAASSRIFRKYGIENFLLYVSRIEQRKNHLLLLKTYLRLKLYKQGISLVFIGRESVQIPELLELIGSLDANQMKFFHWIEQVEQQDLADFYGACRIFVYPSRAEGFGIPPLEAAVCHVPVLCSSVSAMEEFQFFKPYMFDPSDGQDFESKLLEMIANPPSDHFLNRVSEEVLRTYPLQKGSRLFYKLLI